MIFFLLLTTLISYGQIFWMGIWKDDNAIFFKLQHINESAGFFGRGLIGEGPYRFSFTPYWFVYKIFGESSRLPYYILIFIFYFFTAIAVYKFFSKFISKKAGIVASILFVCGFIASEGFFWISNAMVSDVSIIFICICLFFYYKYFLRRNSIFYLLAIIFYWAAAYFTAIRSYYFIGIVFFFELIFFVSRKPLRSVLYSILRFIPFFAIFYYFFISGADSRSGLVKDLIQSFITGKLYIFYGFLSSITNVIFSDSFIARLFDWQVKIIRITTFGFSYVIIGTIILSILGFYILFRTRKNSKKIILFFSLIIIIWSLVSNHVFNVPVINLNDTTNYTVYLGGVILLFLFAIIFVINQKVRRKYIFLLFSFLISIAAYWAYEPLVTFNTTHRYLVGAFFVLVGMFGLIYVNSNKKVKLFIILWGAFNLISSVFYQNQILQNRSFPVDSFYSQLKVYLPSITKGDLFYFDLGDNESHDHFQNAISTASMPDETAFAWRYGVDRYDFKITSTFNDFISSIKTQNTPFSRLHTFYYINGKLIDTTDEMRKVLEEGSLLIKTNFMTQYKDGNLKINLKDPISTLTPTQIYLNVSGNLPDISKIIFPYVHDSSFLANEVAINFDKRSEAFRYLNIKKKIFKDMKITTSSDWMNDTGANLNDGNTQTNWRSNRLSWGKEKTNFTLDLGGIYKIGEFIWVNGFGNSTPTKYSIDISIDGKKWENVSAISNTTRIDSKDPQIINFKPKNLRYIKMNFYETLDGDAPQIAEVWTTTSEFDDLNVKETEEFLNNPFGYVPDIRSFESTLVNLNNSGEVLLNEVSKNKIIYDGVNRTYMFTIPQGGITISQLMLDNLQIPGNLVLESVSYKNLSLKEMEK